MVFLALSPLLSRAQYAGAYEEYKENVARGETERIARESRSSGGESQLAASRRKYNRYNQYGDYIYGSHPGDTPYNTYPGPLAGKRKLTAWRAFRDDYNARKEAQKEARRE